MRPPRRTCGADSNPLRLLEPRDTGCSGLGAAAVNRAAVPVEETWRLEDLYPDDAAFRSGLAELVQRLPALEHDRGRLADSPRALAEALEAVAEAGRTLSRLHAYASMRSDTDTRVPALQAMQQSAELAGTEMQRRIAWLRPEILALEPDWIESALGSEPGLAPHAHFLRTLMRLRPHVLGPAEEHLLAEAGLIAGGPDTLFGIFHNAEMPRPEVALSDGSRVRLTPAAFARHRASKNRADRRTVFEAYFPAYKSFEGTLGQNLHEQLKIHVFNARARRYPSCRAASLAEDNVPEPVYDNLIEQVRRNLPLLHRYYRLRARALGLERLEYLDLHCPLADPPRESWSPAQARDLLLEAMAPLGGEYVEALSSAFRSRWIDWHPTAGKRSGAYATGSAYDVHPYMLLNYQGDYEGVSTLAHEAGHALHSHLSNASQPWPCAAYSVFVAEVASTFNEALLIERLSRDAADGATKRFLLSNWLDAFRATLFRQAQFAEFEREIHRRVEDGEVLTGEMLSAIYLDLLREYQGHAGGVMYVDDIYAVEWAFVPHFYYGFYVYQYATGIVASTALAEAVLAGEAEARGRYLDFLRSGGSDDPLVLLRRAGVDLERPGPYEAAFLAMGRKLDELEALLERDRRPG
jgi:oligoendopeptidase F